jgi:hypothetical protein
MSCGVRSFRRLAPALCLLPLLTALPAQASLPEGPANVQPPGGSHSGPELRAVGRRSQPAAPKRVPTEIRLSSGLVFDTRNGEPSVPVRLRAAEAVAPDEILSLLVQVQSPVQQGWIRDLEAASARIETFVPNSSFLVRVSARDRAKLDALSFVDWTGHFHPAYRISAQPEMLMRSGRGEYAVLLFDDADVAAVSSHVSFLGGALREASSNGINKILLLELDRGRIEELASHPDVQWVEPRLAFTVENANVQWVDMTNVNGDRKVWDEGITGLGQVVMVGDSGIRTTHDQFRDNPVSIAGFGEYPTHRKIIAYKKGSQDNSVVFGDASFHGTHTSGTFAGNDAPNGTSLNDGVAKDAKIWHEDIGGTSPTAVYPPGDLNDYFAGAYAGNAGGAARVSSNSWGASNGGAYDINCMTTDQFAWNHKDFLICFSSGNSGPSANTVGSPAGAKGILTSGGTLNGTSASQIYSSTSRGATDDGRYKPTVCSPASGVVSAYGGSDTGYVSNSGTSMSCPNLAGSATLARQYFTDGWYPTGAAAPANSFTPSAALLRAMMVNSGVDNFASYSIPDNNIGWGRILLDNVMYFPGDTRRTVVLDESDGVVTGEVRTYEVHVAGNGEDVKITLVWTDPPSTPLAASNLINDLDLVVSDGSSTYLGNVWSGGQSVTGGSADDVNVEENVRRATPLTGTWTIEVHGGNVPMGPQPFALVVSGDLGGAAGVVALDKGSYGLGGAMTVRVEDTDAGGSVSVDVSSDTESTPESIVIAGADGVYEAAVPLTALAANGSDGQLSVSHGDVIAVTYDDASPAHTASAAATVQSHAPVITAVDADPTDVTAMVTWQTDTYSDSQVEFGTTPALGSFSTYDAGLVTGHAHLVEGLAPETTYYFDVLSTDHEGNVVRDDFGGMHYRFTTGARADVLLVIADENTTTGYDKYDDAFAATGWTYNTWYKAQANSPDLGDSNTGMRSYKAVWWQVGWEQYPPFDFPPRNQLSNLHDGGARIAFVSHDVAWAFSDNSSSFYSAVKKTWFEETMHSFWQQDPSTWSQVVGLPGDPISGAYTGGVSYTPHRSGAAGDEVDFINGTGTGSYAWENTDVSADDIAVKWENGVANGTNGVGVWGGTPTKTVSMFFEWLNVNAATPNDPTRADILDKTIIWLIGADHPDAAIVSPNGGNNFTASPVSVSWTQAADGANGRSIASTRLEYSDDGGMSWNLITASPGSSPYSWDVSALPTGQTYRVRAVVADDGTPELLGTDGSDADFTIAIPGNETRGPVVVAGSPAVAPEPLVKPNPGTLTATVTDAMTGGSTVVAAEWSSGASPAAAGTGTAMTGAFGTVQVAVSAALGTGSLGSGAASLWVRGQDAAGNWGPAAELPVQVNGGTAVDAALAGLPDRFELAQSFPNPFRDGTRIAFALPEAAPVDLRVYNVGGQLVRTLVDGPVAAGRHVIAWDGRDEQGERVSSGVYFYRINAGTEQAERKTVRLK